MTDPNEPPAAAPADAAAANDDHQPEPGHTATLDRRSTLWWALVLVPLVVAIGLGVGGLVETGEENLWFAALEKPALHPPGWVFGAVWTVLYALMGFALALVVASDRQTHKGAAIAIFVIQLAVNLAWTPIFFGANMIALGFFWILLLLVLVIATIAFFARVSRLAAALLVPYLAWVAFAALLNLQFWQVN